MDAGTLELELGAPAAGGGCAARAPDGRVVFVRHGLPGERVLAVVTEEHATWARADAVSVLEPSADRVDAPCPHAGPGACGGCDYQHVALPAQRALKALRVEEQLRRVAKLDVHLAVAPGVEDGDGLGTRTRVRFAVDEDGRLAMRRSGTNELVVVATCPLGVPAIGALELGELQWPVGAEVEAVALDERALPTVVVTERGAGRRASSVLEGPGVVASQSTVVGALRFEVPPGSFWQVHERGPALLVDTVLEGLALSPGDRVLDLYCGAGLFTAAAAREVGPSGAVVGIDAASVATAAARANLSFAPWARVVGARVDRQSVERHGRGSTHAVLDPPRRGVDRAALTALSGLSDLRRVVSVSCEPSTFARDLRVLLDEGWELDEVRAFDLFEMTEHVECVAFLRR